MSNMKAMHCLTAILVLSSCGDQTMAPRLQPGEGVGSARNVSPPVTSLIITISNSDSLGNPYGIKNDGMGAYVDGTQNVQAVLDQYGTLAFNTLAKGKTATRWVIYNFNNPVDPSNAYRPNPANSQNYHFSTGAADNSPFVPIQNLGVDGNPSVECIYMGNSFANAVASWRVSFQKRLEPETAYAVVTRVSVSPAVWTIAPGGSCSPVSNVGSLRSGDGSFLYGYYNLPFLFTLRAK